MAQELVITNTYQFGSAGNTLVGEEAHLHETNDQGVTVTPVVDPSTVRAEVPRRIVVKHDGPYQMAALETPMAQSVRKGRGF